MKTVYFLKAGQHNKFSNETFYITSKHRKKSLKSIVVYHNNDYSTIYKFPIEFFRENFKFNYKTHRYTTQLLNKNIPATFYEIVCHEF